MGAETADVTQRRRDAEEARRLSAPGARPSFHASFSTLEAAPMHIFREPRVTVLARQQFTVPPHIKWQSSRRGYVSCTVAADAWTTEYKTVAYVSKPDAPVDTPTKWRVEHGRAGIQKV